MEGKNAGVWTVALLLSSNEAGMTLAEYQAADLATLAQARVIAQRAFSHSEPDYMIDSSS